VAQERIKDLERRNEDILKQMNTIQADAQQGLAQAENLSEMTAMLEETQKALEKLKQENEELRAGKDVKGRSKVMVNSTQIENELRLTLEEVARLQNLPFRRSCASRCPRLWDTPTCC
jgi:DNA repair exonuclease SbcCD ATPase subunit